MYDTIASPYLQDSCYSRNSMHQNRAFILNWTPPFKSRNNASHTSTCTGYTKIPTRKFTFKHVTYRSTSMCQSGVNELMRHRVMNACHYCRHNITAAHFIRQSLRKSQQLLSWPKMWKLGKWSTYILKHVVCICKRYHQVGVYVQPCKRIYCANITVLTTSFENGIP
jgi:hypothetical protein